MSQEYIKKYPIRLGASFRRDPSLTSDPNSNQPHRVLLDLPDALHSSNADLSQASASFRQDSADLQIQATIPPFPQSEASNVKPLHLVTSSVTQPDQHEVLLIFSPQDQCYYLERGVPTHTMCLTDYLSSTLTTTSSIHSSRARSPLSPYYGSDTEPMHMDLDSPEPASGSVLRAPYEAPSVPVSSSISARMTKASPLVGYGNSANPVVGLTGQDDDREEGEEEEEDGDKDAFGGGDDMDVDAVSPPPPSDPWLTSNPTTRPSTSDMGDDADDDEEGQVSATGTLDDMDEGESAQGAPEEGEEDEKDFDLELDLEYAGQDEAMRSPTPRASTSVSPHVGVGGAGPGASLGGAQGSRSVSRSPLLPPPPPLPHVGVNAAAPGPSPSAGEQAGAGQDQHQQQQALKKVKIMSLSSRLGFGGGDEEEDEESSSGSASD